MSQSPGGDIRGVESVTGGNTGAGRPTRVCVIAALASNGVIGAGGGASHAIVGTLVITGVATIIAVPVGLMAAIYLNEYGGNGRLSRALTFFVDVMTGIPSIVAGLRQTGLASTFSSGMPS